MLNVYSQRRYLRRLPLGGCPLGAYNGPRRYLRAYVASAGAYEPTTYGTSLIPTRARSVDASVGGLDTRLARTAKARSL